ncbi:MAG: hypothetical protein ACI9HY_000445 [Planctomycetaceae bacterium]|jgi:hypothetical protein
MKMITIYWRNIPSQVIVKRGRSKAKQQLSARFQEAIDRAAMRAGKGSSDAYLEEWHRIEIQVDPDTNMETLAATRSAELEASYSDDDLTVLIRNKGFALTNIDTTHLSTA